jgi:hypothetical protein
MCLMLFIGNVICLTRVAPGFLGFLSAANAEAASVGG